MFWSKRLRPARPTGCAALGWVCALALGLGSACAASPAVSSSADAGPELVVTSDAQRLQLTVYTAPSQPPSRGLSTVTLDIVDPTTGEPQEGLTIDAVPWMPAHAHGTSVKTAVQAKGSGVYVISRVNFYMGGAWDLRLTFSGAVSDRATLHFSIP